MKGSAIKLIISAVTIYLLLFFLLIIVQRSLMYVPYALDKDFVFPQYTENMEEVNITCDDSISINALYCPKKTGQPLVLMFHGNAGNITHRDIFIQKFSSLGYPFMIFDYHGYGKSGGKPSEINFYRNAEAVISWLRTEKNILPEDIVVFAKSIGTGPGVEIALRYRFKGIILESALCSTVSIASSLFPYNMFPTGLMIIDRFDNLSKIPEVGSPVLFIHGKQDSIIPYTETERLYAKAASPKKLVLLEHAGHNDIQFAAPGYWSMVNTWIRELDTRPGISTHSGNGMLAVATKLWRSWSVE